MAASDTPKAQHVSAQMTSRTSAIARRDASASLIRAIAASIRRSLRCSSAASGARARVGLQVA
jgi:hypothetical protein